MLTAFARDVVSPSSQAYISEHHRTGEPATGFQESKHFEAGHILRISGLAGSTSSIPTFPIPCLSSQCYHKLRENFRPAIFKHRWLHSRNQSVRELQKKLESQFMKERETTHPVTPFSTTVSMNFQQKHLKLSPLCHLSRVWLSLHSAFQHKSPPTQYFLSSIPLLCDKIPLSIANLQLISSILKVRQALWTNSGV